MNQSISNRKKIKKQKVSPFLPHLDFDDVLEDIMDIKTVQIKGEMLFSETIGKPKDHYNIIESISSCTLTMMKKVKNKFSNCVRSMKVIKKAFIDLQEDEKNFMKEIAILRTLDHLNILKIYEFYQDDKCFYLISEDCNGGDLFEKIQKGPLNEYSACYIIYQLLSAIVYCHSNNIVHRDIKCESILIESTEIARINDEEIELMNIRLSDFSSARSFNKSKKLTKKVGTPYYIAPEVLNRNYNEKCDVWSIGVLSFILLCGKPPFWGDADKDILSKVKEGKIDMRENEWSLVSLDAINLIKSMLKFDANKRLSSVECLKHIWFRKYLFKFPFTQDKILQYYSNIVSFKTDSKYFFQQASLAYMIHHVIQKEEIDQLRKFYSFLDTNGDGKMAYSEIVEGFQRYIEVNEKELLRIFRYIDQAKTGCIEFEEFARACINKQQLLSETNLQTTFTLFTKQDTTKTISCLDFKNILGLQTKFSDKTWENIIKQIDINGDNQIEYDEFKEMMLKFISKED